MNDIRIVIDKLNVLVKLTAANVIQGKKFKDQVALLSSVGLQPIEIASILSKTPNHVHVTLNTLRKEKSKKKSTKKAEVVNQNGPE